jgi:2-dehydro-3-deoxyphosphooctonate aldolase (KDO 8-P synthase)
MAEMESELLRELKGSDSLFLLAGPNVIQSEEHCLKMCRQILSVTESLGIKLIFKSSWDKANRTSASSFRGPGLEEGLRILQKVKDTFGVPIVTDVHDAQQCAAVGEVADIIQIPGTPPSAATTITTICVTEILPGSQAAAAYLEGGPEIAAALG